MTRLYVTGSQAVNIPAYGVREPGEFFEMESSVAELYAEEHANLSLTDPAAIEQLLELDGVRADEVPAPRQSRRGKHEE